MASFTQTDFRQARENWSTHKVQFITVTGPAAYVAGGDAFLPSALGWNSFDIVDVCGPAFNGSNATRIVTYDYTNQKFVWFVPNTGAEASGDLSTYTFRAMVTGHG